MVTKKTVHYGLSIISGVFLDRIEGVYTDSYDYFIILSGLMIQNNQKHSY